MNTFLVFALIIKHFVVDFGMQTKYQYSNKGDLAHPGGYLHVALHGCGTLLVFAAYTAYSGMFPPIALVWGVIFLEMITHFWVDFSKVNICKKFNLTATTSELFWVLMGADQLIHVLILLFIATLI